MCVKNGNNDEQAAIQAMLDQQKLAEIVAPEGCPITVLPVPILALVCRCLDASDLLCVSKGSRTLQAAATHPLTFAHGNRFTVDPWRWGVRTVGPTVQCRVSALPLALQSRRFSSFRMLTLDTDTVDLRILIDSPAAPVLHALTVCMAPTVNIDLTRMFNAEFGIGDAPSLAYLRVLSIYCSALEELQLRNAKLPPRLELLQLQPLMRAEVETKDHPPCKVSRLIPADLALLLAPLAQLRTLVVRDQLFNAPATEAEALLRTQGLVTRHRTSWLDLLTLASIESAAPQIDSIVWMVEMDYNEIANAMGDYSKQHLNAPWPKLTQVRTLQIKRVMKLAESDLAPNPLLMFPSLTELRYTHAANQQAAAGKYQGTLLNQLCAAQLSSITHLTLTEAGPSPFNRSGWTVPHGFDLAPLLRTLPHLTFLGLARLRVDSLSVFRFAPKLETLHDLFWPVPYELVKAEEMPACFPSLTELTARAVGLVDTHLSRSRFSGAVYSPLDASLLRPVLYAIPHLLRVSINTAPMTSPSHVQSAGFDVLTRPPPQVEDAALLAAFAAAGVGSSTGTQASSLSMQQGPCKPAQGHPAVSAAHPSAATFSPPSSSQGTTPDAPFSFTPTAPGGPLGAADSPAAFAISPSSLQGSLPVTPAFAFAPPVAAAALPSAGLSASAVGVFEGGSNPFAAGSQPSFTFGSAAASPSNPFGSSFSFAPSAPGGPSLPAAAADSAPLSFALWTSPAGASSPSASMFSFATAATAPSAATSAAPSFASSTPVFAFSASPSAFAAAAAPPAAVQPLTNPFVFAATASAGLPQLTGVNPFAQQP